MSSTPDLILYAKKKTNKTKNDGTDMIKDIMFMSNPEIHTLSKSPSNEVIENLPRYSSRIPRSRSSRSSSVFTFIGMD